MPWHSIPRRFSSKAVASDRRHHCSELAWRCPLPCSVVDRYTMDFDWGYPGLGVAAASKQPLRVDSLDAASTSRLKRPLPVDSLDAPSASTLKRPRRGCPQQPRKISVGSGCAGLLTEGWALRSIGVRCVHALLGMTRIAHIIALNRHRDKIWCSCPENVIQ